MSRSASRTKLTGHSAENSCSCLTFFFAPTLREGPIENQLVEHLHSLSRESLPRILSSPSTNYLLCLDVSTEAVHSDPQLGAAATVDTTWYGMPALVSPASSMKGCGSRTA